MPRDKRPRLTERHSFGPGTAFVAADGSRHLVEGWRRDEGGTLLVARRDLDNPCLSGTTPAAEVERLLRLPPAPRRNTRPLPP